MITGLVSLLPKAASMQVGTGARSSGDPGAAGAKPKKHYCFVLWDVRSDLRMRAKHLLSDADTISSGDG
jgi:hypothetical protein